MALQIGIGNFGAAFACNIFRTQDAPRYILGREYFGILYSKTPMPTSAIDGLELMFVGIGLVSVSVTVIAYKWINKKRDEEMEAMGGEMKYSVKELKDMGDRAPDFRYTL